MDKAKAMERLDAIEKEAKELRKVIENATIEYNPFMLYVGIINQNVFIMVGNDDDNRYSFYMFAGRRTEHKWDVSMKTGQECIDSAIRDGMDIHEFSDTREAFNFFLANYEG